MSLLPIVLLVLVLASVVGFKLGFSIRDAWEILRDLAMRWPIVEFFSFIALYPFYHRAWHRYERTDKSDCPVERTDKSDCPDDRMLGVTVVNSQLTAVILASTLIVGLIGSSGISELAQEEVASFRSHLWWAIIFSIAAVFFALFGFGTVVTYCTSSNVAVHRHVVTYSIFAFAMLFFALIRSGFAAYCLIFCAEGASVT